jgi:DNA-binding NtrC family response regulator
VAPLASLFLQQHVQRYRKAVVGFEESALRQLEQYSWPGNVRELDHAVERAVLMAAGSRIAPSDLLLAPRSAPAQGLDDMSLEEVEAHLIRKALARFGNAARAAEALGLSRSAMYRRMQKRGIAG